MDFSMNAAEYHSTTCTAAFRRVAASLFDSKAWRSRHTLWEIGWGSPLSPVAVPSLFSRLKEEDNVQGDESRHA